MEINADRSPVNSRAISQAKTDAMLLIIGTGFDSEK